MKKLILILLALVMVMSSFAACSDGKKDNETATETQGEETKGEEVETENEYENIGLEDGLNFGEATVNIVGWDSYDAEFIIDEVALDGDPVADAVYKREMYTENLLNVNIEIIANPYEGNTVGQMSDWCKRLKAIMEDPATPVDLFYSYSRILATATVNGLNQDLTQYDNFDLTKEWWPKNIQQEFSLKNKLFITTGDIATGSIFNMYTIFYNREMLSQLGKEDPVKLVKDKEWTIDKFVEITTGIYEDLDSDGVLSAGDKTGFTTDYWGFDPIIQGAGFKILKSSDEDGKYMELSDDFLSTKFDSFLDRMGKWAATDYVFCDLDYTGNAWVFFKEGRAAFYMSTARSGKDLQGEDIKYGILPPPMLDPVQQNGEYVTTLGNTYSIFSMTRNCKDGERAAAVLQTLGYYGYKLTTPAVFEITMKGKYAKLEEVAEMFEVVRKAIGFDLGLLYMRELDSINDKPTQQAIGGGKQWLGSVMNAPKQKMLGILMRNLNKKLNDVVNA